MNSQEVKYRIQFKKNPDFDKESCLELKGKIMNRPNEYDTPEIYERELANLESRMDKSISLAEKHRHEIHPSISFIQAVELYGMGIDATQLNPKI